MTNRVGESRSILIYTKTGCPWCIAATDYLKEKNISHEEKNVTENPEYFKEMETLSGQTKSPTIVIDKKVYPDSDVDELRNVLEQGGMLS